MSSVVDAFGHVSIRHPEAPDRYLMSRARAPECIEVADLMEFTLDGTPIESSGRKAYAERHIHGAIYETNPGVRAVVHNHSPGIIPFGITGTPLRPVMHMCASMGAYVPIWDSRTVFGDTNLLVTNMVMGRDLAAALGHGSVALMRGHGCVVAGAFAARSRLQLRLPRAQRRTAAEGRGSRPHHVPHRRRNRGGSRHAQLVYLRARLGVLVPASRARVRLPPDGRSTRLGGHQLLPPTRCGTARS